jgi:hypothetical protein
MSKNKLNKLLAQHERLQAELKKSQEQIAQVKVEMAAGEMQELFDLAKKFSRLLTTGQAFKLYEDMRDKLRVLHEKYDVNWSDSNTATEFKKGDLTCAFYVDNLFNIKNLFEDGLVKIFDRMVRTKNFPGNPLDNRPQGSD